MNRKQRRAERKLGWAAPGQCARPGIQSPFDDALRHHRAGRKVEAEQLCRQILAVHPRHADSLHLLGEIALEGGRYDLAGDLIGQAVAIVPHSARFHSSLGNVLRKLGRLAEAVACYRRAIELKRDYPAAHNNLGNVYYAQGRLDEAITCYRVGLELAPSPLTYFNLGRALRESGSLEEAAAALTRAVDLKPDFAEAHIGLGLALADLGRLNAAVDSLRRAIALKPGLVLAHYNLADVYREMGDLKQAAACYRRVIELDRNNADGHFGLALVLLQAGDFESGWSENEWRFLCDDNRKEALAFTQPMWSGQPTEGGTILLWVEQGLGDSIQFIRYAPALARLGWRVVVLAPKALERLFALIPDLTVVISKHDLPHFDVHCPLLSLPRLFGTAGATIPAKIPYLAVAAEWSAAWRQSLASSIGVKVGIVWRGRPSHKRDRKRSMDPALFAGVIDVPGLSVVSLQLDGRKEELAALGPAGSVLDAGPELDDFADTAALIANLDLVITVDTSVCHLAGALGIPTWILLDFASEWRWMLDREDSPWYPTVRLFRQPKPGDWDAVIEKVRVELRRLVAAHSSPLAV